MLFKFVLFGKFERPSNLMLFNCELSFRTAKVHSFHVIRVYKILLVLIPFMQLVFYFAKVDTYSS